MIVDTSALAAIVFDKPGASTLIDALLEETALLPALALTEFQRVAALRGAGFAEIASDLMFDSSRQGSTSSPTIAVTPPSRPSRASGTARETDAAENSICST